VLFQAERILETISIEPPKSRDTQRYFYWRQN